MRKPHGNSRLAKIGRPMLRRKKRPGAPKANRNARKHGLNSAEFLALQAKVRDFKRRVRAAIAYAENVHQGCVAASLPPVNEK